LENPRKFSL
jgi:brefeldin A-inhibited guanine nucleotide-exchange protein